MMVFSKGSLQVYYVKRPILPYGSTIQSGTPPTLSSITHPTLLTSLQISTLPPQRRHLPPLPLPQPISRPPNLPPRPLHTHPLLHHLPHQPLIFLPDTGFHAAKTREAEKLSGCRDPDDAVGVRAAGELGAGEARGAGFVEAEAADALAAGVLGAADLAHFGEELACWVGGVAGFIGDACALGVRERMEVR